MERVTNIRIGGLRSIQEVSLPLTPLNVLIGSNAAGKSNVLSAFRLLNASTERRLQDHVARQGGASSLLHYGPRVTTRLHIGLEFSTDTGTNKYDLDLVHVARDRMMIAEETVSYSKTAEATTTVPFVVAGGAEESGLQAAIDANNPTARYIKYRLDRFRAYHFHDTSDTAPLKQYGDLADDRFLRADAGNLAAFLLALRKSDTAAYNDIRGTIRLAFPRFDDFVLDASRADGHRILLRWRERGSEYDFGPHQLSDGTLRFIALCVLLRQPAFHPNAPLVIVLDEPELGLHPYAIELLATMLGDASQWATVIVSTQSATLLTSLGDADAAVTVERDEHGRTHCKRLSSETLEPWLAEYSLGDLWQQGALGAKPVTEGT